jgi:aerobic carbon-monoxide dehydrogenase medium subunit
MIPAAFEYEVAESVEHARELLGRFGEDAKVLAGGQSLIPAMKLRLSRPSALVDLGRIGELAYVRDDGDWIAIGAMTRYRDLHEDETLRSGCPLLAHAAGEVGDPQVRHMGTIGGAAAHGDPGSDMASVLLALEAELVTSEGRTIPATEFFQGVFTTALEPTEVLTEIRVPTGGGGWSYQKFHPRAQDWAIVGVAVATNGGTKVALTNMGPTPLRAKAVEDALAAGEDPASAARAATDGTEPIDDPFATAEYRRHLVQVLVRRAVEEASGR